MTFELYEKTDLVFKPIRNFEVNIANLSRGKKFKVLNEYRKCWDTKAEFNNEFAHLADKILVTDGKWVEVKV